MTKTSEHKRNFDDPVYESDPENIRKFTEKRTQEVNEQETFGTPDLAEIQPMIDEILAGKTRSVIIAMETKDGLIISFKSNPFSSNLRCAVKGLVK